jgi:hypothetical protein
MLISLITPVQVEIVSNCGDGSSPRLHPGSALALDKSSDDLSVGSYDNMDMGALSMEVGS